MKKIKKVEKQKEIFLVAIWPDKNEDVGMYKFYSEQKRTEFINDLKKNLFRFSYATATAIEGKKHELYRKA